MPKQLTQSTSTGSSFGEASTRERNGHYYQEKINMPTVSDELFEYFLKSDAPDSSYEIEKALIDAVKSYKMESGAKKFNLGNMKGKQTMSKVMEIMSDKIMNEQRQMVS